MNADTLALAWASLPAMRTSSGAAQGQDVAEDGVERFHNVHARRDGLGDLLRAGRAVEGDQLGGRRRR